MQTATRSLSGSGKLLGIATLGALFCFTKSKNPSRKGDDHSAAFADGEKHPENFDQTRSAGSDGMRDTPRRGRQERDRHRLNPDQLVSASSRDFACRRPAPGNIPFHLRSLAPGAIA